MVRRLGELTHQRTDLLRRKSHVVGNELALEIQLAVGGVPFEVGFESLFFGVRLDPGGLCRAHCSLHRHPQATMYYTRQMLRLSSSPFIDDRDRSVVSRRFENRLDVLSDNFCRSIRYHSVLDVTDRRRRSVIAEGKQSVI